MKNDYEIRGEITVIFLDHKSGRMEALIDTADLPKLLNLPVKWYARWNKRTKSFYATGSRWDKKLKKLVDRIEMHRFIMNNPIGFKVDHKNHNTLNSRRLNLRPVDNSQNMLNRKGPQRNNTSGFLGVSWNSSIKKWRARLNVNRKTVFAKDFDCLEDAAYAVKEARTKFAPLTRTAD